ncbi:hypothetical protein LCI18_009681 [Fusarium solani-melongenae]|uniref:Uncharacterized protein n=1 Tax=Fusarium solani subsp. cucurbitae TaxID=2747967 RepID=A0ACD3ZC93_FUSSC|nr:hypothetical protein LCI18_009681 [Fusarium solani-melongenae]
MQIATDQPVQKALASPNHGRAKKQVIDDFLADLSPWDILYLRGRIRDATIVLSGLQDLPPELICLILSYLGVHDFRACRLVCRAWATAWTQDSVLARACRNFFPGLLEWYPTTPGRQLFSMVVKKRKKWERPFSKYTWMRWNQGLSGIFRESTPPSQPGPVPVDSWYPSLYAKEKLAWQPSLDRVIVDDLRTGERHRFLPPGGAMSGAQFRLVCISDQLLVMREATQVNLNRVIFIANLTTKEWKIIYLPGPFATAHTEAKTVGIGCLTGPIVVYTWGGRTTQLDLTEVQTRLSGSERLFSGNANVLPHPTQDNVVFGVWACSRKISSFKQISFVVVKFENAQPVWWATEDIPNPRRHANQECNRENWLGLSFACRKSDNYGSFALGIYRSQNRIQTNPDICYGCLPATKVGDWGAVSFNVLTQTFKHYEYKSSRPDLLWMGSPQPHLTAGKELLFVDVHLWNEDLLLAATTADRNMGIDLHLQTIHPVGSGLSGEPRWAPIRLRDPVHAARTRIFQDDDFVVVPTIGGVVMFEPSDSPSEGKPVDNFVNSQDPPQPLSGWGLKAALILIKDDAPPESPSVTATLIRLATNP